MCDPVTAGFMAASALGTVIQGKEESKNAKRMAAARNDATLDNLRRVKLRQAEAEQVFDNTLPQVGREQTDKTIADATTRRSDAVAANVGQQGSYAPVASSAPTVVQGEIARKTADAIQRAQTQSMARGRLAASNDANQFAATTLSRSGNQLSDLGNMAQGTASLLPLEQQAAMNNANKGTSGFGEFLKMAGMVGGAANSMGAFGGEGLFGAQAPTGLGKVAAQNGLGPWTYSPPVPGMPGSAIYSIPLT